jgi:hypothetical protein
MSLFTWALVFIGLAILAILALGLVGLRLWRRVKSVAREASAAAERLSAIGRSSVGPAGARSDRDI